MDVKFFDRTAIGSAGKAADFADCALQFSAKRAVTGKERDGE